MILLTDSFGTEVLAALLLIVLICFNIYIYLKVRRWVIIVLCFMFSIIFSVGSFDYNVPFSPYLQIFYILISGIVFLITSMEAYSK